MRAAQVALAVLTGVLIAASVALFITNDNAQAWIFMVFGLLGFLALLGMVVSDSAPRTRNLPPPR